MRVETVEIVEAEIVEVVLLIAAAVVNGVAMESIMNVRAPDVAKSLFLLCCVDHVYA